jgi:hypothetical protein
MMASMTLRVTVIGAAIGEMRETVECPLSTQSGHWQPSLAIPLDPVELLLTTA